MSKYISNAFYCLNCGSKSFDLPRCRSHQRSAFHRKALWCYRCKMEINHVECKNQEEVEIFMENYQAGNFKQEAEESINYLKGRRMFA